MIHQVLMRRLDKLAARYRLLRTWRWLATVWLAAAVAGVLVWIWKLQSDLPVTLPLATLGVLALAAAGVAIWRGASSARDYVWVAQQIETAFPELRTCLLAAVEQRPDAATGEFGYLQTHVIWQALDHSRHNPWSEIVPVRKLLSAAAMCGLAFTLFGVALAGALLTAHAQDNLPAAAAPKPPGTTGPEVVMTVEPGDTEVERGSSLLVLARIQGPMPVQATLEYEFADGRQATATMPPSLADPVLSGRIPLVEQPLEYQVKLEGQSSPRYRVTVFEYPRLERADAHLVYPTYTSLGERLVQDVRTVSAVEGTRLTLRCYLNKPVASATLVNVKSEDAGESIVLVQSKTNPVLYEAAIECRQSRRLKLELRDERNRTQQRIEQFTIHVLPNQPPSIKPTFPARDLEVSALEELDVKAAVVDDYGVRRLGLSYSLAGQPAAEVILAENATAKQKHEIVHSVKLEELKAEPDQLLSYHWWVEDLDSQGQVRRTSSDMYFAEVRPFEEIFRQGEQPPGGQQKQQGQSQNAQDAQELAKLQKEIASATWKLIRREIGAKLTDAFPDDVEQVRLSQVAAIEQAGKLAEKLQDEQSQAHMEDVLRHMQTAVEQLAGAHDRPSRDPLAPALAAEQAAYQALLKLRAREHEVVRQQQQQAGQSSQSASRSPQQQQMLDQLDLQKEENRYETQRAAEEQKQESAEERENRQVLNRLRELARRQHDLNERLKELQTALEAAQTPEEKEEIRRQLKRLEDEQRLILQDTDELQSRLDQPENQERMSDERQQLDQTRDQVRRASEALQEQRVSQAAAAGTRAERQFDELREEFRRRASNRFQQEMQQMRDSARELEQKEQEVAEEIRKSDEPKAKTPTLQETDDGREKVAEKLGQQRQRLATLQDQMRDTIERAEATEPLLSERLYDTARNLRDQSIDKALQSTERSVRQGLTEEAQKQEAAAGEGLRQLREGIEKAAEGVLGDETEALRRARDELKGLSKELNEEVRREGGEQESGVRGQGSEDKKHESSAKPGQSAQQPGKQGEQPGKQQQTQQPGQQGQQQSEQQSQQQPQPGQQQGQQPGQPSQQPGQAQGRGQQQGERTPPNLQGQRGSGNVAEGAIENFGPGNWAPLTGEQFREWSDRLRDVEEMVDDPELRADAARIRERARALRAEFKRHSKPPNWDLVRDDLAKPLTELHQRVSEELLRRESKKAIVPLDRDPVPPQYSEKLRRYFERLGSGK